MSENPFADPETGPVAVRCETITNGTKASVTEFVDRRLWANDVIRLQIEARLRHRLEAEIARKLGKIGSTITVDGTPAPPIPLSHGRGGECDGQCVCPAHGTPMLYWAAGDDHACQDTDCRYGHGMKTV